MKLIRSLPVAALWLTVCLAPSYAQEAPAPKYTLVYQVKHADAKSVATAVRDIEQAVRITWDGDTHLILQGAEADVNRVVSSIIEPLDKPATSPSDKTPVAVIRLPKVPNDRFMSLVEAIAPQRSQTRLGFDPQNRVLVIRGPQADIDSVKQLVTELNKPMRALTVTCYFLRGTISASASKSGKLPEQLQPVAVTLQKTGLGEASLLAPLVVKANDGGRFKSSSAMALNESGHAGPTVRFDIGGVATVTEGDQVELMLDGRVEVPSRSDDKKQDTWFSVNTTIATALGSYAVIAAAPSTTPDGDFVALVARVDRAE